MIRQTLRCGKGEPQWDLPVSLLANHRRRQTSLQKQAFGQIQTEMPSKSEDWRQTVPHFAGAQPRTRGCERVHTPFPSHTIPTALHHWARAPLQWKDKSLHQVFIRENKNAVMGKNPKPQAPVTGAAPQTAQQSHSGEWGASAYPGGAQILINLLTKTPTFPSAFL